MKKINEGFYEIEEGLYAELRGVIWFVTDEAEDIQAGPFSSLEALQKGYIARKLNAVAMGKGAGDPKNWETITDDIEDLVTLREAAAFLPITRQGLEYRRNKGILGVSPVIVGRSVDLYSLRELKEAFPA